MVEPAFIHESLYRRIGCREVTGILVPVDGYIGPGEILEELEDYPQFFIGDPVGNVQAVAANEGVTPGVLRISQPRQERGAYFETVPNGFENAVQEEVDCMRKVISPL